MSAAADLRHIQKLVAQGFDFHCARLIFLQVNDAAVARRFIVELVSRRWICHAADSRQQVAARIREGICPISLGLTYVGLEKLRLKPRYLDVLRRHARAFSQGASARSAECLGDTGQSAAQYWEQVYQAEQTHLVLLLHANDVACLSQTQRSLWELAGQAFTVQSWSHVQDGEHLGTDPSFRVVHFGLRDGISNPVFDTITPDFERHHEVLRHQPGELLLGYPDDQHNNPWLLGLELPEDGAARPLGCLPEQADLAGFFRNASFGALRKIEQDEEAFRSYVQRWAMRHGNANDIDQWAHYLRAKMVGRWDDGSPVRVGQWQPDPEVGPVNDFQFKEDSKGEGCPFGAHIRRMNPRGDDVVPFRKRPLVRRGIPYGPAYRAEDERGANQAARGLMGLFFCANLEGQFEHLLREWSDLNPMGTGNAGQSKDPLIGQHEHPRAAFDIPMADEAQRQADGLRPFVTTRGTLYAMFPGLQALLRFEDQTLFQV